LEAVAAPLKLAYRLLLIVGHTLGDLALPLMARQCEVVDATMETLSPAQAERLIPAVEHVLEGYLAKPGDLKQIGHELRLEVGAERFARGELSPERVEGAAAPRVGPAHSPPEMAPEPPAREAPDGR
jgi:hypothetical protein